MGKLIFRIIHILFLVVGVVLVTSITDANYRQNKIVEYSHEAYESGDLTFMVDGNYLEETPVVEETVTQNDRTFNIYVYDVVYAINEDGSTTFNDGFQLIIEQVSGEDLPYATDVTFSGSNNFELTIGGIQYYDLPLYVTYDQDNGKLRINRDELGSETINTISVTVGTETYLELSVDIDVTDLIVMDQINTYLDTHDMLNVDDIDGLITVEFLQIDTIPVIVRNLAIYIVIATAISAGIIFYRRRHLGRGRVNPRLREDIKKLNNQTEEES